MTAVSKKYCESAYITARSFILHALTTSIPSFDDEILWIYLESEHGRLPRIIAEAKQLISASEGDAGLGGKKETGKDGVVGFGAVLGKLNPESVTLLKKTVARLEKVLVEKGRKGRQE
jgi:hypothetical protein